MSFRWHLVLMLTTLENGCSSQSRRGSRRGSRRRWRGRRKTARRMKGRTRGAQTRGGECCLSLVLVANSGEAGEGND
jgi:hypothetical protein